MQRVEEEALRSEEEKLDDPPEQPESPIQESASIVVTPDPVETSISTQDQEPTAEKLPQVLVPDLKPADLVL